MVRLPAESRFMELNNDTKPQPIFDLQDVWHTYAGSPPIDALRGINLQIYPGEYVAIIGANGSGKSTLARHLNALLLPSQGKVLVAGIPTNDTAQQGGVRRVVQMVFQHPDSQIVATTVEEDVAFGPENFGVPEMQMPADVRNALETVGMWDLRQRPPHRLSAGQKQRVAIAGALALRPQALVLDEATSMLDPAGRRAVVDVLRTFQAQGITLVIITHEMEEAAEASRVVVLHRGQLAMDGDPHEIFSHPTELRNLGLDIPQLADFSLRLGLPVCLTVDELLAALGPAPAAIQAELENTPCSPGPLPPPEIIAAPVVLVEDLQHAYLRGTPLETPALRGIDMQIARGKITGLIGPTGSGKSTLMQHINGLIRPQVGKVVVDGKDWADPELDLRAARQKVGLLFQQPEDQLFERYVGDDVAFGPRQLKLDPADVRQRVKDAMEAVGLPFETFKDRLTTTLSGGEQRRAALAGVLAMQPTVLVVDEPTAGLDPHGRAEARAIFRRINQAGVTVIFGSHRMEDVLALCERVVALREGQVVRTGPVREILGRPDIDLPVLPLVLAASRLCEAGWPVPVTALTVPEIVDAIIKAGFQVGTRQPEVG